ncbi:MAG: class I SAM-dependent methyltransferase [Promethearchaeota archaeon]
MKKSPVPRTVGFSEGIDDEAVGLAFNKMQKLPQFALIRKMFINRILSPVIGKFPESPESSVSVLDFGYGTGYLLKQLRKVSKRRNLELILYGIDISDEIINVAQRNLSSDEKSVVQVQLASYDGQIMPYSDNYFDIVATSLSLHHWGEPVKVLNEIMRVIKPNGYMLIFDLRRDAAQLWHRFLRMISRRIVPKALKKVNEPMGSLLAAYTLDELSALFYESDWKSTQMRLDRKGLFLMLEAIK